MTGTPDTSADSRAPDRTRIANHNPTLLHSSRYAGCVFENDLVELDAAATLAAAEANEHTLITAETRRLQIAANWADLHPGEAVAETRLPGTEHPIRLGGDGTPTVADFAPAELGCVLRISDGSACRLIGDALDLQHRLRLIWKTAQAGQVPAYQARHIASATRHLTVDQAAWVDAQLAPSLGAVSWGRLQTLLEATIIQADPIGAEHRAAAAAQERFVRLGRTSEHGLKLIIARAAAGHAIWFKATVDRIADILARQGDTDPVDVCAAPKPSASSPNPPTPSNCCANTKQMTGTDPPNPTNRTIPKTKMSTVSIRPISQRKMRRSRTRQSKMPSYRQPPTRARFPARQPTGR